MPLSQIIKKINKENAPPGGWRPEDKVTSFKRQASSFKLDNGSGMLQDEFRKEYMTELEKLKKMLVSAHDELRGRKQKNTPTFGAMMFMLQAIVQCNAALNERKKDGQNKIQT